MLKSFRVGGIHPPDNKISKAEEVIEFPLPKSVVIPLSQHIGAPASACVAKGDVVKTGQIIGKASGFVSANIHSSVSGTVTSVDLVPDGGGVKLPAVTIKVEGDEWLDTIDRSTAIVKTVDLTNAEIIKRIAGAGIVGMGGATFPTHVKLSVPDGKKAEFLIINGVECEPYLTSDYRLMLERGDELMIGINILGEALGAEKIFIGIENNKPDAVANLTELAKLYPNISVIPLKVRYPQGGEKQLIDAILRREVPSGGLPIDIGVVVHNVGTAYAVYEAVQKNKPLIERIVTVTGKSIKKPSNYLVRVGTPIRDLIDYSGGLPEHACKVINGGPMMGHAVSNLDSSVSKGTSGIVVIGGKPAARKPAGPCIKCAKCVEICPMAIEPYLLYSLAKAERYPETEPLKITDCIECGSCSYICPASLPLLDYIKLGKSEVIKLIRTAKTQE